MLVNVILTVVLCLLGVMNFVQSAKMAQKSNWSTRAYRVVSVFDVAFAVACAVVVFIIWTV